MNIRSLIALLLLVGLAQPAVVWSGPGKPFPDNVAQLVAETKQAITTINMQTFKDVLDSKAYDMIIDVREPNEYAGGHVPGAINIPRGVIEFRIWRHIGYPDAMDTAKRIYLYCKSGSRCALATRSLQDLGFSRVVAVDMKINDWVAAGYPLEIQP